MTGFLYCAAGFASLLIITLIGLRFAIRLGGRKVKDFDPEEWITQPSVDVYVSRKADNSLLIKWVVEADKIEVNVYTDPSSPDSAELIEKATTQMELVVPDLDSRTRYYFRLDFIGGEMDGKSVTVAERFLPLGSVNNSRDIGGYKTTNGQTVRWGRVYRTGNLSRINGADLEYLEGIGIKLVCDLRSTAKINRAPDIVPAESRYVHFPIYEEEFNKEVFPVMLFRRHQLGETLAGGYTDWPENGALAYGKFFECLADPANLPLMYHCTAGKDRAGIATAILFSLLGVPDETIIADYSLTNLEFDRLYQEFVETDNVTKLGIPNSDAKIMLAANPEWIQRTLTFIRTEYGDASSYLREAAGLSQGTINSIQKNLLTE